jgi:phosphoglycolate phosphatase
MSKIAVLVPGIGYTCDRPLLYYSGKIASSAGYDLVKLNFRHLGGKKNLIGNSDKMRKVFEKAYAQAENQLVIEELEKADEVLFLSKSVGTAVAAAFAQQYSREFEESGTKVRHVYYTPVAGTFIFMQPESGIAFHGTADPWVDDETVIRGCKNKKVPLYIYQNVNHSLESGDVMSDLEILSKVMSVTEAFICEKDSEEGEEADGKHMESYPY